MKKLLFTIATIGSIALFAQGPPFGAPPSSNQGQTGDGLFTFSTSTTAAGTVAGYGHTNNGGGYETPGAVHNLSFPCPKGNIDWNPVIGYYGSTATNAPCPQDGWDIQLCDGVVGKWGDHFGRQPVHLGSISNTGNDIQTHQSDENQKFEATVWDGDVPSFSFIDKNNPLTVGDDPTFVTQLMGTKIGVVSDPDIVISPILAYDDREEEAISILIVYELTLYCGGEKVIAVEQYNYLHQSTNGAGHTGKMTPASLPTTGLQDDYINIISESYFDCNNPNVDVNNFGKIAITYESGDRIFVVVNEFGDYVIPFNVNDSKELSPYHVDLDAFDPDITIGSFENHDEVTIVYNKMRDDGLHAEVYPMSYSNISNTSGHVFPNGALKLLNESIDDPRISSPRDESDKQSIAVTTINPNNEVYLHTDLGSAGSGGNNIITYLAVDNQVLDECQNERPSITYANEGTITIAWTYNDCIDFAPNEEKKAIALNFDFNQGTLLQNIRVPQDPNYFMSVTHTEFESQNAISLSSVNFGGENSIYYSLFFEDPSSVEERGILHKRSQTASQPLIRKGKFNSVDNLNTEFSIYPNPSSGIFNVEFESEKYNLIIVKNSIGQTVQEINISSLETTSNFDLSNFPKGLYLVSLIGNDTSEIMKITKQ